MSALAYKLSPQQSLLASHHQPSCCSLLRFHLATTLAAAQVKEAIVSVAGNYVALKLSFLAENGEDLQFPGEIPDITITEVENFGTDALLQATDAPAINSLLNCQLAPARDGFDIALSGNIRSVDLGSLIVIKNELLKLISGQPSAGEEISYLQFAEWQHQLQQDEGALDGSHFWAHRLYDPSFRLQLENRPAETGSELELHPIPVSAAATEVIRTCSDSTGHSPEILWLTATLHALQILSAGPAVSLGLECDGREFEELFGSVGLLCKLVPFSWNKDSAPSVAAVAELLEPIRSNQFYYVKSTTRYNYQFAFVNAPAGLLLATQLLQVPKLKIQVLDTPAGFQLSLLYRKDIFDEPVIQYTGSLIAGIAESLAKSQPILSGEDRLRLLGTHTPITLPAPASQDDLVAVFRHVVSTNPGATAIATLDQKITYRELDERSSNLAAHLVHELQVIPGDFVGILADTNEWIPVCMLAVLKAGAAFVPLDTDNPRHRLAAILEDIAPRCILTTHEVAAAFADLGPVLCPVDDLAGYTQPFSDVSVPSTYCAYMIYTSGTTGKPKGVMVSRANLLHYVRWFTNTFRVSAADTSMLQASYAYDLGYTSLWGCLLNGASICLLPAATRSDADWMVNYIADESITFLKLTPSVFYLLLKAENLHRLAQCALRLVVLGGEKIDTNSLLRLASVNPSIVFANHYGPTETTVGTVCEPIPPTGLAAFIRKPVIGRAITGSITLLLNAHNEICIPGETGEICIGGNGVAIGYHNREQLNQEKFTVFHLAGSPVRIYRTGDLGYWLPDGRIVIDGRSDSQVKVRGHRIELDELRQAMTQTGLPEPLVRLAASLAFGEELVCYYRSAEEWDNPELRTKLLALVPDYMVPSFFVRVSSFPLTPNGKIDFSALPDPYTQAPTHKGTELATETEKIIAATWSAVMNVPVSADTDFFQSGGDSIKAIQIVARLGKQGLKCQLADIFNFTTVRALAAHLAPEDQPQPVINEKKKPLEVDYTLSPMQEAMFFQYTMYPASRANNIIRQFEIAGDLDIRALESVLEQAFRHYDILRMAFVMNQTGTATIRMHESVNGYLQSTDISALRENEAREHISKAKENLLNLGFSLSEGPLLRIHLFRWNDRHILLWNYHHIIMDGWCLHIIIKEIMAAYAAVQAGGIYSWAPYTSFTTYLDWLQKIPQTDTKAYWTEYLVGYDTLATVPTDPELTGKTAPYQPAESTFFLPEQLSASMQQCCNTNKVTLNQLVQAAWGIVLAAYNGTEDVVFGITVSGRPYEIEGFENMLGLFINTIPLRIRWLEQTTIAELLLSVRNNFAEVQPHQYLSLAEIQSCSGLRKDLLDHVLVFENYPLASVSEESAQSGVDIQSGAGFGQVNYDFSVVVYPGDQVCVSFMYNASLYGHHWISKIYHHIRNVLETMVSDPSLKVSDIQLTSATERQQLLEWSATPGNYDIRENMVERIVRVGTIFPEAYALTNGTGSLSYQGLLEWSERLARCLLAQVRVLPGDRIAIYLTPCLETVVAIFGILRAGGAYVPLDPEYPAERTLFMLQDSNARAVVSLSAYAEKTAAFGIPVIDLHAIDPDIAAVALPHLACDQLAYIIYTSGTTGRPKGCLVTHGNLAKLFLQRQNWLSFHEKDVWILAHSYVFDFSVWEIFGALVNGGRLVIPERSTVRDTLLFAGLLRTEGVTILNQTPMAFYYLAQVIAEMPGQLSGFALRMVILGGERLDYAKLQPWISQDPGGAVEIYNLYGITETTVHTTWHRVTHEEIRNDSGRSVIGKPIPSTSVYVANHRMQLCPVGVFGELLVGGEGVCSGYHQLPDLTASRFGADIFQNSGRLYKSGDVGRWLPGGILEYAGRRDSQLQIRGYRIEPGEITACLQKLPSIRQAFVGATTVEGLPELTAWLLTDTIAPAIKELRAHLAAHLPTQFVPQHFVFLDAFPLTTNGKIDATKLPTPNSKRDTQRLPVAGAVEQALVEIWQRELACPVLPSDNFFDLGGHSLKAMRMIGEVQKRFGISLPPIQLYTQPVLSDLGATIRGALGDASQIVESPWIHLHKSAVGPTLFFLPPGVGYAFGFAPLAKQLGCNVFGINFIEENTFTEMAAQISALQPEGDLILCGFSAGGSMCFHVTQQLEKRGRNVKALIFLDSKRFMSPETLTETEIQAITAEYLADPRAQEFITSPVLKEAMRRRISASLRFIHNLQDDGLISADIYLITSETYAANTRRTENWLSATTGGLFVYPGFGPHAEMISHPYLAPNTAVYRQVLETIQKPLK